MGPTTTRNFSEEAREQSERLRQALKAEVRKRGFRQLDLEKALERSHGYFSHLFAGRLALTLEGVLEILLVIGANPADFFALALTPEVPEPEESGFADIERVVLRTLKRYLQNSEKELRLDMNLPKVKEPKKPGRS